MTPYEVVINAYNNEVIARNDAVNTVTLRESDVTDLIREDLYTRLRLGDLDGHVTGPCRPVQRF
jgi:hypothetical protein